MKSSKDKNLFTSGTESALKSQTTMEIKDIMTTIQNED